MEFEKPEYERMVKAGFAVFTLGSCIVIALLIQSDNLRLQEGAKRRAKASQTERKVNEAFRPISLRDPLPPVVDPPAVSPEKITGLDGDDLVLGLEINGQSRAYPINFISEPETEVLNDVLGGVPIAVTWCTRCSNGVVYERRVDGEPIILRVAGMLWRDNLVMVDRTSTLWSQLSGDAMRGPRKGESLTSVPAALTDWKSWQRDYPATTVVDLERNSNRHRREFLAKNDDLYFGISDFAEPRAWKLKAVSTSAVVNDWIRIVSGSGDRTRVPVVVAYLPDDGTLVIRRRRLKGRALTFELDDQHMVVDRETRSVWDLLSGKAISGELAGCTLPLLPGMLVRRDAWARFAPGSTYWNPTRPVHPDAG
jgi:hypothetical protein